MSKHFIGNCRVREEFLEEGLPLRLAWELAKCQARPPYPPEEQQQPDPRYGEETRRRVRRMYDVRSTMYDVGSSAPVVREDGFRAGKWMRAATAAAVLAASAGLWIWSLCRVLEL